MILWFMLGWAAATWWWPWVLSFYEPKPLPRDARYIPDDSSVEVGPIGTINGARWRRDGGP